MADTDAKQGWLDVASKWLGLIAGSAVVVGLLYTGVVWVMRQLSPELEITYQTVETGIPQKLRQALSDVSEGLLTVKGERPLDSYIKSETEPTITRAAQGSLGRIKIDVSNSTGAEIKNLRLSVLGVKDYWLTETVGTSFVSDADLLQLKAPGLITYSRERNSLLLDIPALKAQARVSYTIYCEPAYVQVEVAGIPDTTYTVKQKTVEVRSASISPILIALIIIATLLMMTALEVGKRYLTRLVSDHLHLKI